MSELPLLARWRQRYADWRRPYTPLPQRLPNGFAHWRDLAQFRAEIANVHRDYGWIGQQALESQLAKVLPGALQAACIHCRDRRALRFQPDAQGLVNWRESLACEQCGLINRWRLAVHLFDLLGPSIDGLPIYITEQLTPLFAAFVQRYGAVIGSEYHGPERIGGEAVDHWGTPTRHEDVTRLSMADRSIGMIGCFDVLEHVPDYRPALSEFHRVLAPGGTLVISVPMNIEAQASIQRAVLEADGSIRHLLEPQYHGDPVRAEGVLCFHEFGWDLLDQLRDTGFRETVLWTVWAPEFGYLGSFQPFYIARKR